MSQLMSRIVKLSSQQLCFSGLGCFSTAATPYLLLEETNLRKVKRASGGVIVDMNLYDPRKEERVKISDQTLCKEMDDSMKIGASRGWVGLKNMFDNTVRLTNIFNPCASVSSHKVITLPPLLDDRGKSDVCCIALSASPSQKEECVVAAKSCSCFISLCRPGDSDWTHFHVPFFTSTVMYSMRDRRFYLHSKSKSKSKEVYEGPVDLNVSGSDFPQVSVHQSFPISGIPKSRQHQVVSSFNKEYLVESPSGDSFIVYWCNKYLDKENVEFRRGMKPSDYIASLRKKPSGFLVFKQDPEQKIGTYTEDIGDLCIFLGDNEAFCVSATKYPGLNPNSIYFGHLSSGFGFYDLSSNTIRDDITEPPTFSSSYNWLAPLQ